MIGVFRCSGAGCKNIFGENLSGLSLERISFQTLKNVIYWGLGSLRGLYLYGWYNVIGSFDTPVGWGISLEATWCIVGGN